jgi:hypothetical protein
MTEKVVQDRIRALLLSRGISTQKMWGSALQSGVPDLFCGRFWIEVKAPGRKLRPSQVDWCETFDPLGAIVYVCDDARQLWDVVCLPSVRMLDPKTQAVWNSGLGEPGTGAPNWRKFCPRVHHRTRLASALGAFASS